MSRHILAIDQGTTGSTALIIDPNLHVLGKGYKEFRQIFPVPGQVEHDPEDIWDSVGHAVRGALTAARVSGHDIAAIGITNQRETAVLWERATLRPIHNALVWQDRRTAPYCAQLKKRKREPDIRRRTGLVIDPYFSGTKVKWLLDSVGGARIRARRGELAFGTIDTFLIARLTRGASHVTEPSNASRTLFYNIHTRSWDDALLKLFDVPREILPEVRPTAGIFGTTRGVDFLPDGIPIAGVAGDQQSALFGQACFNVGEAKCTYGTGAFLLMNIGVKPVTSKSGLLTTVAWDADGEFAYALEGSAFIAGAAVQWLRDGLGIIRDAGEIEALARSVGDNGGVMFVPALTGLGAPYWRPDARGVITGITRGTTRAHIARATLEGIAYQNAEILRAMERDSKRKLSTLKVDGGAAANDLMMQFQSDILGVPIARPAMLETTALGAACLAGLGCGIFKSRAQIRKTWKEARRFKPQLKLAARQALLKTWQVAVNKA